MNEYDGKSFVSVNKLNLIKERKLAFLKLASTIPIGTYRLSKKHVDIIGLVKCRDIYLYYTK